MQSDELLEIFFAKNEKTDSSKSEKYIYIYFENSYMQTFQKIVSSKSEKFLLTFRKKGFALNNFYLLKRSFGMYKAVLTTLE